MLSDLAIDLLGMPDFWDRFNAITVEADNNGLPTMTLKRSGKPTLMIRIINNDRFTVHVEGVETIECELKIVSVIDVICTN